MNDTVQKLMSLADKYRDGYNPLVTDIARQALEAELTRLFTPLSDEQLMEEAQRRVKAAFNAAHGIGEAR